MLKEVSEVCETRFGNSDGDADCLRIAIRRGRVNPWESLLPVLQQVFDVEFEFEAGNQQSPSTQPWIVANENGAPSELIPERSEPFFRVPESEARNPGEAPLSVDVQFADDPAVPFPFRGRSLRTKVAVLPIALSLERHERALAFAEGRPIWAVSALGSANQARTGLSLPELSESGCLADVLNGERFLELLPLLEWFRNLTGMKEYGVRPVRACFMFDDPNLHWSKYGCVDYGKIVEEAARVNYHVAFAMVPLDTWATHEATARLFRTNSKYVSLLVHGNDHTRKELGVPRSAQSRERLIRQAVRRIDRFERRTGLCVARVMAAPHGACTGDVLHDLRRGGFEGATISHGSLRAHNRSEPWTQSIGYLPSELIRGCPVVPRFRLNASAENAILLAAYLDQAIIMVGHHQDLQAGTDLLGSLAAKINSLGDVQWGNLSQICRGNYYSRIEGDTLRIRPSGTKLVIVAPTALGALQLEQGKFSSEQSWRVSLDRIYTGEARTGATYDASISQGTQIAISAEDHLWPAQPPAFGPIDGRAVLRRLLSEARDRWLSGAPPL